MWLRKIFKEKTQFYFHSSLKQEESQGVGIRARQVEITLMLLKYIIKLR